MPFLALLAREQVRQPVIALRADHEIDDRRAADDFLPSACATQPATATVTRRPVARGTFLQPPHAAELRIDLFGRLFADVAGVEDDQVGVVRRCRLDEPLGRQQVRHTMGIVDVHLAAVGFDVELALSVIRLGALRPSKLLQCLDKIFVTGMAGVALVLAPFAAD